MKFELTFAELNTVRERISAPYVNWVPTAEKLDGLSPIYFELRKGIEISLDKVEVQSGLYAVEGQQIVLYIKDHSGKMDVLHSPKAGKRVHLKECQTLEDMRAKGRFGRYIATNRRDNIYAVDVSEEWGSPVTEHETKLLPCKNCLKELNYKDYSGLSRADQNTIWNGFDIEEFFEEFSTFFAGKPEFTDKSAPVNYYTADWSRKSTQVRKSAGYICGKCKVDLSDPSHRRWLHTHHKNGQKGDNSLSNLEALCLICHSEEPGHETMYVDPKGKSVIKKQRRK